MRIPDEIKDCVAFLCIRGEADYYRYGGTGFFISVQDGDKALSYLVTAKHNVESAKRYGPLYVRANSTNDAKIIEVTAEWFSPEDEAVDVAMVPLGIGFREFDISVLSSDLFVTDQRIADLGIGIGDDLIVVGLFTQRHGRQKNLPIVRIGSIASMPDEPLQDENTGLMYDAYLAELRSIGGLSGSPVFVSPTGARSDSFGRLFVLGLIRGHWDFKQRGVVDFADDESRAVNMGIATITPIGEVIKLAKREDVTKHRKMMIDRMWRDTKHVDDSGFDSKADSA